MQKYLHWLIRIIARMLLETLKTSSRLHKYPQNNRNYCYNFNIIREHMYNMKILLKTIEKCAGIQNYCREFLNVLLQF